MALAARPPALLLALVPLVGMTFGLCRIARSGAPHSATDLLEAARGALSRERPTQGLRLDGREIPVGEELGDAVREARTRFEHGAVSLEDGPTGMVRKTTFGALGVHVDDAATLRRARAIGRRGSLAVRLSERLLALRSRIDVPLALVVDPEPALALVTLLKEAADTRPTSARYDFTTGGAVPHELGSSLAPDAAVDALAAAAEARAAVLTLPRVPILPRVTTQMVESIEARETIATYRTAFRTGGKEAPRAHNIEVAAARLDGLVLGPGDVVSFNGEVGPRTADAGFDKAFQIYKGEMALGVGGGTCQVASTLHAAAVYAGLDVVERAPHSRPLGYIGLGLDATVVYPEVDLKIKNPWNFPVVVHTHVENGTVSVELRGERVPSAVRVSTETLRVWPFVRRVEVHPELAPGRFIKKEKGLRGYDIRVMRRTIAPDGSSRVETSLDRYPPTPELFWVAPDVDVERALPAPPDGEVPSPAAEAAPEAADNTGLPG